MPRTIEPSIKVHYTTRGVLRTMFRDLWSKPWVHANRSRSKNLGRLLDMDYRNNRIKGKKELRRERNSESLGK